MVEFSTPGAIRFADDFTKAYAGDALNTAVMARRLGAQTAFLTGMGDDPFAFGLKQLLMMEGIEARYVRAFAEGYTGLYFIAHTEDGDREFLYYRKNSAASLIGEHHITEPMIQSFKMVYSTGITLGISASMQAAVIKAFRLARKNNIMTVFDPNYRHRMWKSKIDAFEAMDALLPYVDVILPTVPDDTLPTIGLSRVDQIMDYFWFKHVPLVVLKAGANGCHVGYRKNIEHVPAMPAERVMDTTGAGDAFNGAFMVGLLNGKSLLDCARLATTAAGLKVQREGTIKGLPNRETVMAKTSSPLGIA